MTISLRSTMTAPPAVGPWPGTTTQTNVDWEKQQQQQMADALQGLGTLVSQAEAAQFARQQEADRIQSQLAAASAAPIQPPSLAMALPYAAAQFSAALSGRPEVGQQADQSLALNRAQQLQRRAQLLDTLANQHQEAARRAEQAGNLTDALKFNTKANMLLKQLDESQTSIREARKTAQDQAFDAWRTMYNARASYLTAKISSASARDPVLAARLDAIENGRQSASKPIEQALATAQLNTTPAGKAKVQELTGQLNAIQGEADKRVESAILGRSIEPPPTAPPPPPPPAAPKKPGLIGFLKNELKGSVARRQEANNILDQVFPGTPALERVAALQAKGADGKPQGRLLAQKFGVDYSDLMAAARRMAAGPGMLSAHRR